jgi:hypothetical protein
MTPYLHYLRNRPLEFCLTVRFFGGCLVIHRPNCVKLNLDLENLDFASVVSRLARVAQELEAL